MPVLQSLFWNAIEKAKFIFGIRNWNLISGHDFILDKLYHLLHHLDAVQNIFPENVSRRIRSRRSRRSSRTSSLKQINRSACLSKILTFATQLHFLRRASLRIDSLGQFHRIWTKRKCASVQSAKVQKIPFRFINNTAPNFNRIHNQKLRTTLLSMIYAIR